MVDPHPSALQQSISLPIPPQPRGRRDFPWLASGAPVIGSLVMWGVTGSAFALVFAFLGPVIAVANLVDDRWHARRELRSEALRFRTDAGTTLERIREAHGDERRGIAGRALDPQQLLTGIRSPEWWRQAWGEPVVVRLGTGSVPSSVRVDSTERPSDRADAGVLTRLRDEAATVTDAPVLVDARLGIGIVGEGAPAVALARAVVLQLAFLLSPAGASAAAGRGGCFDWVAALPHAMQGGPASPNVVEFRAAGGATTEQEAVVCAVAPDLATLPRQCRIVVRVGASGQGVLERHPGGVSVHDLRPWFVSEAQAVALAERGAGVARADRVVFPQDSLPASVALGSLTVASPRTGTLPAVFCSAGDRPATVDLVRDGPHAIVGGTTGSGKSELLVSWVLALAAAHSPLQVNFLLVDFKGGSSFSAVSGLPHTVGLITDLDQYAAARALASLRAELRHRERVIADAGCRSLDELEGEARMPRLVIVVDEFAVVVTEFPELQAVFSDLAARGRSLGIHLILCTQRPAGVVRDSVLANCSLRLSLRVTSAADSSAVIGSPDAAALPPQAHGRCLLSVSGAAPVPLQVALAGGGDVEAVLGRWSQPFPVRRPWLDPLPASLPMSEVIARSDGRGLAFGIADLPAEQQQPAAWYDPVEDGNLSVLGARRSGKSGVLSALAAAADATPGIGVVQVPDGIEGAWDTVRQAVASLAQPREGDRLYLLDDLDMVMGRFGDDHRLAFGELLARLLREGPRVGVRTVVTASHAGSGMLSLLSLCDSRLVLRMQNRHEHLLADGDASLFDASLGPGGGSWRGDRLQVAHLPSLARRSRPRSPWEPPPGTSLAIVAAAPEALAERMRAAAGGLQSPAVVDLAGGRDGLTVAGMGPRVLVGDVSQWQSQWSLFAEFRSGGSVLFTGCSVAEFRSLSGFRDLPPPIGPEPGAAWLLTPGPAVERVQLPHWLAGPGT